MNFFRKLIEKLISFFKKQDSASKKESSKKSHIDIDEDLSSDKTEKDELKNIDKKPRIYTPSSVREQMEPKPDLKIKDSKSKLEFRVKIKPTIALDLKKGRIKIFTPVLYFSCLNQYNKASPITFNIKVIDKNNNVSDSTLKLDSINCIIDDLEQIPVSINIGCFKIVECNIESRNPQLNKEYKYINKNNNFFIFNEKKDNHNIFIDDLNISFKTNSYLWILYHKNITIEPPPKVYSHYVAYEDFKLECMVFDEELKSFSIFDGSNNLIEEIHQIPKLSLIPSEPLNNSDDYSHDDPLMSSGFQVIIEASEKLLEYPKILRINNVNLKKLGIDEEFNRIIELNNENTFEITPEIIDDKIGNYQINLEFYKDSERNLRIIKEDIRASFRYCPIRITKKEGLILPVMNDYLHYTIDIQAKRPRVEIFSDVIPSSNGDNLFHYSIPTEIDEIRFKIADNKCLNPILIKITIPRIKWRVDGLESSKFSGDLVDLPYIEDFFDENKLYLEIIVLPNLRLPNLNLEYGNESLPITNYKKGKMYFHFALELIYERIHKLLRSSDSTFISLNCDGSKFPIIKILRKTQEMLEVVETYQEHYRKPYVELNYDNNSISLIIPKQRLFLRENPTKINYLVKINQNSMNIAVDLKELDKNFYEIDSSKKDINAPLESYEVEYPLIFQKKTLLFEYSHQDPRVYIFFTKRHGKSKMVELWDGEGYEIEIDNKHYWILHQNTYSLTPEPIKEEPINIWDYASLKYIDLREFDNLSLNSEDGTQQVNVPCKTKFKIIGNLVPFDESDSQKGPLYTGTSIKLTASRVNSEGWKVKIQNKTIEDIIPWKGTNSLIINCPNDLKSDFGEFRVEILNNYTNKSLHSLKFRYIKNIEVHYNTSIILPKEKGYEREIYQLVLAENYDKLRINIPHKIGSILNETDNGLNLFFDIDTDNTKISILERDNPDVNLTINLRIPRLKWKFKKQDNWSFEMITCDREEFEDNLFFDVSTNDLINDYEIYLTFINRNDLKTIQMKKTSISYPYLFTCDLHAFLNNLKENSEELIISTKIYDINEEKEYIIDCIKIPEDKSIELENGELIMEPEIVIETDVEENLENGILLPDLLEQSEEIKEEKEKLEKSEVLEELTHDTICNTDIESCINLTRKILENQCKCLIKARGGYIARAALIGESLRNFYFTNLQYESIDSITIRERNTKPITEIQVVLSLIEQKPKNFLSKIPQKNIGMFVGYKPLRVYIKRANAVLYQQGYCNIKARGMLISKTITICEILKKNSKNLIKVDDIIIYSELIEDNKVSAIYIKISKPINSKSTKLLKQKKIKSKIGKSYKVGSSIFEI